MFLSAADLERGYKRVNVSFDIETAQKLDKLISKNGNPLPGTLCKMYLTEIVEKKYSETFKKELPGQTNMFSEKRGKKKK